MAPKRKGTAGQQGTEEEEVILKKPAARSAAFLKKPAARKGANASEAFSWATEDAVTAEAQEQTAEKLKRHKCWIVEPGKDSHGLGLPSNDSSTCTTQQWHVMAKCHAALPQEAKDIMAGGDKQAKRTLCNSLVPKDG